MHIAQKANISFNFIFSRKIEIKMPTVITTPKNQPKIDLHLSKNVSLSIVNIKHCELTS